MVALLPCALFAEDCGTVAVSDSTVAVTEVVADTLQAKHPNRIQRWRDKLKQKIAAKLSEPYDTVRNKGYWWRAMKHGKVNFKDSTMGYPKFVRFCYRVYVWGDKAFNTYDSTYVVPTGKLWKLTLKNQNWIDNFMGSNDEGRALFTSGMSSSIGFYLSFMAVSVGYSLDLDRLFGGKNTSERMEFSFTCARFTAEVHKSTNSGKMNSRIKLAGSDWVRGEKMRALRRETKGLSATYFVTRALLLTVTPSISGVAPVRHWWDYRLIITTLRLTPKNSPKNNRRDLRSGKCRVCATRIIACREAMPITG